RPAWDGPEDAAEWGGGTVLAAATAATRLANGWVQALVQVDGSIYHLHRQLTRGGVRWFRQACLRLADHAPFTDAAEPSRKLAQVSGERDNRPSGTAATLASAHPGSGVRGTDLGVRVDHAGRTFLLFGDTHWASRPWLGTRDAIAEVPRPDDELPAVRFHGAPLTVRGGRVTLREYDVPQDGFSLDGELYAFFSSDHFRNAQAMGRSVLARARTSDLAIDPREHRRRIRFDHLATFSDHRFVNVSVQRRGTRLLIWGTGAYRADDLRLARVELTGSVAAGLRRGDAAPFLTAVEYWTGSGSGAGPGNAAGPGNWSATEADAVPLLSPGALGEISVRWVPALGRYLMLAMSGPDDPAGAAVLLRTASEPWGPWSPRLRLLDWIADGMRPADGSRRFIRSSAHDVVGDAVFAGQAGSTGAAYAPYFFDARRDGDAVVLRYTLSTWNPYQVVLMRHRLRWDELG
ncbi:MAG: DUF4185 domain-containing protein, partial [Micropruina sp.]|uniref:DUF4185 domain-containing protein n=1 Tax=Micropruina sp. TaxID=2737536 RepID=UPI0039E3B9AF